jgi:hypothetical protein
MHAPVLLAIGIAILANSCIVDPADPLRVGEDEIVQGELRVTLTVDPQEIDPPGAAVARLTYENLGNTPIQLVSSWGCLSFARVYRGDSLVPFPSTQYACTAAFSTRELRPGSPLVVEWPLPIGGENGLDAPSGTYRFVADLNTHPYDLERTFVVR